MTGLAAARSKTVTGIAREMLPAQSDRALNKFITEYNWDENQLNYEWIAELQNHDETRWSQDGYIVIDDSVFQRTGRNFPVLESSTITLKAKPSGDRTLSMRSTPTTKGSIPLVFRQYEKADDEDQQDEEETKYELVREIITELEEG